MKRSRPFFAVLFFSFCSLQVVSPVWAQTPAVTMRRDGSVTLENALVRATASNRPGAEQGLQSWIFKPTGFEMIDVLYGQTDYIQGHALGERWDTVTLDGIKSAAPAVGTLYVPLENGVAADGSGAKIVQVAQGDDRWQRTFVLRRDLAALEVRYELKNLSNRPGCFALRFHSALSPGARGKYQNRNEDIWLPTDDGALGLDQSLSVDEYLKKFSSSIYFLPMNDEPRRSWARNVKSNLAGNWAAQVNRESGDGVALIIERKTLAGFYNSPGATLEPVLRAVVLQPGESWSTRVFLSSFTGVRSKKIVDANPLYAATAKPRIENGTLGGEVVPCFAGTLQVVDEAGKIVFVENALPTQVITLHGRLAGANWSIVARDTTGAIIGSVNAKGEVELSEPKVSTPKAEKPVVEAEVYSDKSTPEQVRAFLAPRDFTVYADWSAPPEQKEAARRIALKLGVGLTWTKPEGQIRVLALGAPQENEVVREAGLLRHSVTAQWPGAGKGAILAYDNYEGTQQPVLLVTGSDEAGTMRALQQFERQYLSDVKAPQGFDFWATSTGTKVYPFTHPPQNKGDEKVVLQVARGEYESAQLVLTAYEELRGIVVSLAPLVNAATGKEIDKKLYLTDFQRRNGPLWLRTVRYFPLDPPGGWSGVPDPLMERPITNLEAERSQALWLTAIIPEGATPGLYRSAITVKSGAQTKTIPIEINVWNFVVPRDGLLGEPYINLENFPPDDKRRLTDKDVKALVENLVEHGMRRIHLGPDAMFRWHFSPQGEYKGKETRWLEVSDDGQVALDASYFDELVETCDKAAKPYDLSYMVYAKILLNGFGDFRRAFPHRFAGRPDRGKSTSQSYYAQEMMQLYKHHLEKRGWMKRMVLKIADEPRGFDFWYDNTTQAAREVGLPMMTSFNAIDFREAEKALDKVALWQVLYQLHNPEFFEKAKAAGMPVSWYNCGPPPRIAAQATASEIRAYLWQAAKADLDVIAWWGIQCWPGNNSTVWTDRYSSWNSVMYPQNPQLPPWQKPGKGWVDKAPIDSIRWELIREGMEDARYVYLLRDLIAQAKKKGLNAQADKAQGVLDAIWKNVFPTLNDYRPEYSLIYDSRQQVAEAIIDLQAELEKPKRP
jgi:hypothetical protein